MAVAGPLPRGDGRDRSTPVTGAVLLAGVVVAVYVVGLRSFTHEAAPGAAPEAELPVGTSILMGACLLLTVAAAWATRGERPGVAVGLASAAAGAALPAWASWTGAPTFLRSVVLVAPAVVAAGLAQVVGRWSPGRSRPVSLAWVLAAASSLVHVVGYDPFADLYCARVCRATVGPWLAFSPQTILRVEALLLVGVVAVGLWTAVGARTVPLGVRGSTMAGLVGVGGAALVEVLLRDTEVWARTTSSWLPWTVAPVAGVVCFLSARSARTRRAVDDMLSDLDAGVGTAFLFAVPGEDRWVDVAGRDVAVDASTVVLLRDEHGPAVRLARARAAPEASALSASRRLALANARLTALAAAHLADVQSAQRRAVQRADAERHRIERDLHDGAQQTLVSAAFHLSAAATRTGGSPGIDRAQQSLASCLARLRELVHGPVPTVLLDEGIEAALEELAAEAPSRVTATVRGQGVPPSEVTVAAYLCAEALVDRAAPDPCSITVQVARPGVRLCCRCARDLSTALSDGLLDRVGALGGSVTSSGDGRAWSTEVWLPCES